MFHILAASRKNLYLHSSVIRKRIGNYLIVGSLFIFSAFAVTAQSPSVERVSTFTDTIPSIYSERLAKQIAFERKRKYPYSSAINAFIKDLEKKRIESIIDEFNNDFVMANSELTSYLQSLNSYILKTNQVSDTINVFGYRSTQVNAMSYGNGIITVMLGLMVRLENEGQLAFVICHELAHQLRGHVHDRVVNLAKLNFDEDLSRRAVVAKRGEFERYTKLKEVMQDLQSSMNHNSRKQELEADSLGLILYSKTKYDPEAPLRVMEILDSADKEDNPRNIDYHQLFSFKDYPGKESWFTYKEPPQWNRRVEETTDKTHPDCKERKAALSRIDDGLKSEPTPFNLIGSFEEMKKLAQFDLIESEYHFKRYGKALYLAIQQNASETHQPYLQAMIGKCFFQLFKSQQNHELGKVLDLPDSRYSEPYNRLLTFIHNLRLNEVEAIGYYYLTVQPEDSFHNEDFLYALWLCSHAKVSLLDPNSVRENYSQEYPTGRYNSLMK